MRILLASTALLFALSLDASAAPRPAVAAARDACRGDVTILCHGVKPGEGRVRACLLANRKRLSPDCRVALATLIKARRAKVRNATRVPKPS